MQSTSAMNSQIYTHTELNTMAPPPGAEPESSEPLRADQRGQSNYLAGLPCQDEGKER